MDRRADVNMRPTLLGQFGGVDLKTTKSRFGCLVWNPTWKWIHLVFTTRWSTHNQYSAEV